jgi:transmembrane sensor
MSKADTEAMEWVVLQAGRQMDPQEQARFEAWFDAHPSHPGAYLRARAIERALEKLTPEESVRPSQETVHNGLDAKSFRQMHGRRRFLVSGAAAAGVAALAVAVYASRAFDATVLTTAKGEFRKVPLADSSTISINGGSRIEVRLGARERRIALDHGEAWFEVAKDKTRPFVVEAGGVLVRAVGTAFAVRRYRDGADVVVTEGVVEVWSEQGMAARRRLSAGEHAYVAQRATDIAVAREPGEVERRLAWREGLLVFRDQSLADAAAEFNRYNARAIVITDPRLRSRKVVGQYRIDQPERFADDLHTLLGVPVSVSATSIDIGSRRN